MRCSIKLDLDLAKSERNIPILAIPRRLSPSEMVVVERGMQMAFLPFLQIRDK